MKKKLTILLILLMLLSSCFIFATEEKTPTINFSGGYTKVTKIGNIDTVLLSDNAKVNTDQISVNADSIEISGEDYSAIRCSGNVEAIENKNGITLTTPELFFNRIENIILINSWVEINDSKNEIEMSGSYLEFNLNDELFNLQISAQITKATDKGTLTGKAESIIYNNKNRTLTLKGNATVLWGTDNYKASVIRINLDTEEISLEGQITGTVNG